MRFTVHTDPLSEALDRLELVNPAQAQLICADDALTLTAVSETGAVTTRLPVVQVDGGTATIPFAMFAKWVASHAGEAYVEVVDDAGAISMAGSQLTFGVIPQSERVAPDPFDAPDCEPLRIDPAGWAAIRRVAFASAKDMLQPQYYGVHVGGGWVMATESHYLAAVKLPEMAEERCVLHPLVAKAAHLMGDDIEARVADGKVIHLSSPTTVMRLPLIAMEPINWLPFMPSLKGAELHRSTVDRAELVRALTEVSAVIERSSKSVRHATFAIEGRVLTITGGVHPDVATETLPVDAGADAKFLLSPDWLLPLVKSFACERLALDHVAGTTPVGIEMRADDGEDRLLAVIQPMRAMTPAQQAAAAAAAAKKARPKAAKADEAAA